MFKKWLAILIICFFSLIFYLSYAVLQRKLFQKEKPLATRGHEEIKSLKVGNKHASLPCAKCHSNLKEHLKDAEKLPGTNLDLSLCGKCHASQYETYRSVNLKSKARVEKATIPAGPHLDKLMTPHGFTKEHDEPRSHIFMVTDHLLVDRAYGGRFQLKSWKILRKLANFGMG